MSVNDIVVVSAARTPIGKFCGAFSDTPSYALGAVVIEEVLKRANVSKNDVSEVIFGQVLTAGQGMNPARHASLKAGLPHSIPACTINQVCGSGLRVVAMACQAIRSGDSNVIIAGGQENMSLSPHCVHMRKPSGHGDAKLRDTMYSEGLTDPIHQCHMGDTAENVVSKYKLSRKEQDEYACASQQKAAAAIKQGKFKKEIVPVSVVGKKGVVSIVAEDEFPRPDTTLEVLGRLRAAFTPAGDTSGSVTAGNSSGVNDGAAAVLLMTEKEAKNRSLKPLCHIASWAHAGVDPLIMGTGPVPAVKKALDKAGWDINDVDLFEINEAFAAPSLAVMRDLEVDSNKVNVHGGSIALGHPLGASGTRILVTLIHAMEDRNVTKGVAGLCIGGGMGIAICVQRK